MTRRLDPEDLWRWMASPPWGRLSLRTDEDTDMDRDDGLTELIGSLWAFAACLDEDSLGRLEATLDRGGDVRDGNEAARWARRAATRPMKNATPQRRVFTHLAAWLEHRLAWGSPVDEALDEWLGARPELGRQRVCIQRTHRAWLSATRATTDLVDTVSHPQHPTADAWLRWAHREGNPRGGHRLVLLLHALTAPGTADAIQRVRALDRQLMARNGAPSTWRNVLTALVLREDLVPTTGRLDVRGHPLPRLLRAWARLHPDAEPTSLHGWLARFSAAVEDVSSDWAGGGLPLPTRFEWRDDRVEAVDFDALARKRQGLLWVDTLVRHDDRADARAALRASTDTRVAASLAWTIDQEAENFAGRVMPSLKQWNAFREVLDTCPIPRCSGGEGPCLVDCASGGCPEQRKMPTWRAPWRFGHEGIPWTTSSVFSAMMTGLVVDQPDALPRRLEQGDQAGAAIANAVRSFIRGLGPRTTGTIVSRETGLRWRG